MSAWYIFSALGFYPVSMGNDEYAIGSPLFDEITVHLDNGKDIKVIANNNSDENIYIQSMKLNGKEYNKNYIKHSDIASGATIEFEMGSTQIQIGDQVKIHYLHQLQMEMNYRPIRRCNYS